MYRKELGRKLRHIFKEHFMLLLQSFGRIDKNVCRIKENMDSRNVKSKLMTGKCCKLFADFYTRYKRTSQPHDI
jgi:hypothetical protein